MFTFHCYIKLIVAFYSKKKVNHIGETEGLRSNKKTLLHIDDPQNQQNTNTTQAKKIHEKWSIFRWGRRSYFMSTLLEPKKNNHLPAVNFKIFDPHPQLDIKF